MMMMVKGLAGQQGPSYLLMNGDHFFFSFLRTKDLKERVM